MATLVASMQAAAQQPEPGQQQQQQQQPALTLRAALALAAQANPVLAAARYEAEAQEGVVLQASARPNPTLSFERVGRSGGSEADGEKTWQLSQQLELGGKRAARMAAAERGRDAAGAALEAQRMELHASVVTAFYDVLVAQERLRLAQDGSELAQRATQAANKRVAAGKVSPVDETKARLSEATVRLEQSNAMAALASARQRLAAYWQQPGASGARAEGSAGASPSAVSHGFERVEGDIGLLPEPPSAAAMESWRAQSPALMPARLELERRKERICSCDKLPSELGIVPLR
eukprot:gene27595-31185_t